MERLPDKINEPPYHSPGRERCIYCTRMMDLDEMTSFMGERFCVHCEPDVVKVCTLCKHKDFAEHLDKGVCEVCRWPTIKGELGTTKADLIAAKYGKKGG